MHDAISKFVKNSNSAVRKVKTTLKHTGNADLEGAMDKVTAIADRLQRLSSRGEKFDEARADALVKVWNDLLELQKMAMSSNSIWSDLPPGEILPIKESILADRANGGEE